MTDWTSWNDAVLTRSEQIDPPSSPCEDCPFYDECDDSDECLKEQADEAARETVMTSEKRKAEIRAWRRYYEARAKASNNYRRMHGLPMVRRPRRRYGRRSKPPDGSGRWTEERNYTNGVPA